LGLTRLAAFLRRHSRIALDTSIFIYQLEANPRYVDFAGRVFAWLEQPGHGAVASTITMMEVLVQPYREHGAQRADEFYAMLVTYPNLDWVAPDLEIADLAARIRAVHRLRTPDALEAATAIRAGATGLVTNDPVFERVRDFETIVLDRLIRPNSGTLVP
jgi:predicted nucleic acid-binding protein